LYEFYELKEFYEFYEFTHVAVGYLQSKEMIHTLVVEIV